MFYNLAKLQQLFAERTNENEGGVATDFLTRENKMAVAKMTEADTLFFIECVHSYEGLWNVSTVDYHKKDARQAALRSVGVRMHLDRQRDMNGELKFVFYPMTMSCRFINRYQ